jgi:hypothetical protein
MGIHGLFFVVVDLQHISFLLDVSPAIVSNLGHNLQYLNKVT